MAKRPSLFHQLLMSLNNQRRIGQSKHLAKKKAIALARVEGRSAFGAAPPGIYSIVTYKDYRQAAHEFAVWAATRGAKWMKEAKLLAADYLQERVDQGYAPATLKKDRSALRKIFDDRELAAEVKLPVLSYKDTKRSRVPVANDRHYSPKRHQAEETFAEATGLRRHELVAARPMDIHAGPDGQLFLDVPHGKGGRPRVVQVRADMHNQVMAIIDGLDPEQPIFPHVPSAMDVHAHRYSYSVARQDEEDDLDARTGIERTRKEKERAVASDLGHNRTGVVRYSYGGKQR
jgi:integrase